MRILVAEDDRLVSAMVIDLCMSIWPAAVISKASCPAAAVEAVSQGTDLVITDLFLTGNTQDAGGGSGYVVAESARDHGVPVIIVTSDPNVDHVPHAVAVVHKAAGFLDTLTTWLRAVHQTAEQPTVPEHGHQLHLTLLALGVIGLVSGLFI